MICEFLNVRNAQFEQVYIE